MNKIKLTLLTIGAIVGFNAYGMELDTPTDKAQQFSQLHERIQALAAYGTLAIKNPHLQQEWLETVQHQDWLNAPSADMQELIDREVNGQIAGEAILTNTLSWNGMRKVDKDKSPTKKLQVTPTISPIKHNKTLLTKQQQQKKEKQLKKTAKKLCFELSLNDTDITDETQ